MIENRRVILGMDTDTDERDVQNGYCRKAVNMRIGSSDGENRNSVELVKGNEIRRIDLPEGENTTIGAYEYKRDSVVYYFNHNSLGNHNIVQYNFLQERSVIVMISNLLNFSKDYLITHVNIVDLDNDNQLIYFVDRLNPPRKFNIGKAIRTFNTGLLGDKYDMPITLDVIDAIKYPPLFPPTAGYITDTEFNANYLNNELWQFKARYIYDDNEKSAFSPISKQTISNTAYIQTTNKFNNAIQIIIPKATQLVKRLEIVARDREVRDFFSIIDKPLDFFTTNNNGDYVFNFYNDGNYSTIDIRESIKPFDKLPLLAGTQSFIEGNRLVYGDIIEEYNNVEIDADLDVQYKEFENVNAAQENLNTIKGRIIIRNINQTPGGVLGVPNFSIPAIGKKSYDSEVFQRCQPIRYLNGDNSGMPYFGSVTTAHACIARDNRIDGDTEKEYLDKGLYYNPIPLAGFVVYLVGTNHKTISKQRRIGSDMMSSTNVYFVNRVNTPRIVDLMANSEIYSEFELKGIPDGEYILRLASHLTTREQYDDITKPYEKTSTFTLRVGGFDGGECKVKVEGGEIKEIGLTEVADITFPKIRIDNLAQRKEMFINNTITFGYLHDNESESYSTTNEVRAQQRITYSRIDYEGTNAIPDGLYSGRQYVRGQGNFFGNKFFFTDHNGFFFIKTDVQRFLSLRQGSLTSSVIFYRAELNNLSVVNSIPSTDNDGLRLLGQLNIRGALSTVKSSVVGRVLDTNGNAVPSLIVLAEKGDVQLTDANGYFDIIVYADSFFNFKNSLNISRYSGTIYGLSGNSQITYNVEENIIGNVIMNLGINENTLVAIYNSSIPLDLGDIESFTTFGLGDSFLKRGASYEFGIVYYDRANRSGAVNSINNLKLEIPFFSEQVKRGLQSVNSNLSYAFASVPVVSGYIYHKAPNWATHYSWVRTKKLNLNNYIQFVSKSTQYKTLSGAITSSNDAYTIEISVENIVGIYNELNKGSELFYTFTKGDRIRFIKSAEEQPFNVNFDLEILNYDIGTAIITLRNEFNLPQLSISGGDLFEIYTPFKTLENNLYFEIGEFYKIENGLHLGNEQNQTDTEPAIVKFTSGDTYLFKRNMPVTETSFKNEFVESNFVNDFVNRNFITSDVGRPNIVNMDIKQLRRPTTIYYSDRFIPETGINGLNSFFDNHFEQYDRNYGSIQRLASFDKRLECYQELKVGQILVEENVIFDQFAQGQVAASEKVLSKIIYYAGEFGIGLHPESFCYYGNRRYFVDYRRGVVCRLSNDGITPISDVKMEEFFEDKFKEYLSQELVPTIFTTYDVGYDELVVAFGGLNRTLFIPPVVGNINFGSIVYESRLLEGSSTIVFDAQLEDNKTGYEADITVTRDLVKGTYIIEATPILPAYERKVDVDIKPITLAFSETTKHWTTFYSFVPEYMCSVGLNIVTFKNGQLFLHDQNANHSVFYGVAYKSELWVPFNVMPESSKILKSIVLYTTSPFDVIIETLNGQETNNTLDDFIDEDLEGLVFNGKENAFYSQVWRDINSVNEDSPVLARINGDAMRDRSFLVKLITNSQRKEIVYQLGLNYAISARNLRETSDIASKLGKLLK
jgi:hypothetical protein